MSLMFIPIVESDDSEVLQKLADTGKAPEAIELQQLINQSKVEIAQAFAERINRAEVLPPNSWEGMLLRSTYDGGSHPDIIRHLLEHFGDRQVAVINIVDHFLGRGPTHFTYNGQEVIEICYLSNELGGLLSYTSGGYLAFTGTTPESHYQSGLNIGGHAALTTLFTRVYQVLRNNLSSEFLRKIVSLVDTYPELHNGHVASPADGIVSFNISRSKLPAIHSMAEFVQIPDIRTPVFVNLKFGRVHDGCSVLFSILKEYVISCANP